MDLALQTYFGGAAHINEAKIVALRAALCGTICLPGDAGYDAARSVWNAMIDRRPAMIIQAAGAADVSQAVNFARNHRSALAVRGGGHNIAGNAVCNAGIMLDLSRMRSVHVDPVAKRARVEGGALLGDVDKGDAGLRANGSRWGRFHDRYDPQNLFRLNQNIPA